MYSPATGTPNPRAFYLHGTPVQRPSPHALFSSGGNFAMGSSNLHYLYEEHDPVPRPRREHELLPDTESWLFMYKTRDSRKSMQLMEEIFSNLSAGDKDSVRLEDGVVSAEQFLLEIVKPNIAEKKKFHLQIISHLNQDEKTVDRMINEGVISNIKDLLDEKKAVHGNYRPPRLSFQYLTLAVEIDGLDLTQGPVATIAKRFYQESWEEIQQLRPDEADNMMRVFYEKDLCRNPEVQHGIGVYRSTGVVAADFLETRVMGHSSLSDESVRSLIAIYLLKVPANFAGQLCFQPRAKAGTGPDSSCWVPVPGTSNATPAGQPMQTGYP